MNRHSNLGKPAKDIVTGFKGYIMGYCQYFTGCDNFLIVPKAKDNIHQEGEWFDINRVKILKGEGIKLVEQNEVVLEDGTRILSSWGMQNALKLTDSNSVSDTAKLSGD